MNAVKGGNFANDLRGFRPSAEQIYTYPQSYFDAIYWTRKAVVIQDNICAHIWFNIAASQGNECAKNNSDIFAKEIPPPIVKAQCPACKSIKKRHKEC